MKKFIPTLNDAKSAGGTLGVMTIGFVGANQVNKFISEKVTKGRTAVKGGLAVVSALGSVKVKNSWLKSLLMSVALFFGVSTLNDIASSPALSGDEPDGMKSKVGAILRKYIPTLGDLDENGETWLDEGQYQVLNSTMMSGMGNVEDLYGLGLAKKPAAFIQRSAPRLLPPGIPVPGGAVKLSCTPVAGLGNTDLY